MATEKVDAKLEVSRIAVSLILERGFSATSGDDIATATGRSARTIWRYFRSKESSVEPLLTTAVYRFLNLLKRWPLGASIEQFLDAALRHHDLTEQEVKDDVAAVRLIALTAREPALRSVWLMACNAAEADYVPIVARRSGRPADDFEVRLCAAATLTAIRLFHEDFSAIAVVDSRALTVDTVIERLAAAIRSGSTLPICDSIEQLASPAGSKLATSTTGAQS